MLLLQLQPKAFANPAKAQERSNKSSSSLPPSLGIAPDGQIKADSSRFKTPPVTF